MVVVLLHDPFQHSPCLVLGAVVEDATELSSGAHSMELYARHLTLEAWTDVVSKLFIALNLPLSLSRLWTWLFLICRCVLAK